MRCTAGLDFKSLFSASSSQLETVKIETQVKEGQTQFIPCWFKLYKIVDQRFLTQNAKCTGSGVAEFAGRNPDKDRDENAPSLALFKN